MIKIYVQRHYLLCQINKLWGYAIVNNSWRLSQVNTESWHQMIKMINDHIFPLAVT